MFMLFDFIFPPGAPIRPALFLVTV